ncbi:hypothetical protein GLOTRDRAFT_123532 [Gloeophyllum trabeum ATCC 11539]|uniref:Uncharacterized protein n=1 Tax=Gloeophyllum trabeum (strain ATCC 11539 / FP-39264 / Madison 617) TaxID=670483 RepID=S7R8S7_GLOTA|nr:uncharacterized protein GLOTRDRAFT_123532 [Gloeophyllum trabeum ATCC 11539]EPQ50725.1 hypothetical protein GLOTRDRAFT_123532 [Gloeophyllum trabeum ATCC 11539]
MSSRVQSPGLDYIHDHLDNIREPSLPSSPSTSSSREIRPLPPPPPPTSSRRTRTPAQDGVFSNTTNRLLARILAREERDARKIDSIVSLTSSQLEKESARANDAERRALVALAQLNTLADSKRLLEQDVSRLREELRLYKNQLQDAQREIFRAQDIVDRVGSEKQDAEAEAARWRSIARRWKEERALDNAREEAHRRGYAEGLRRGFVEGRREGYYAREDDEDMVVYGEEDAPPREWDRDRRRAGEEDAPPREWDRRRAGEENAPPRERDRRRAVSGSGSGSGSGSADEPPARPPSAAPRPSSRAASRAPPRAPTRTSNRTPSYREPRVPDSAPHAPTMPFPTLTTPVNPPSPHHAPPSPLPRSPEVIQPIPVYTVGATPPHPPVAIPPDGWVPAAARLGPGGEPQIPLPPPHEMGGAAMMPHEMGGATTTTPRSQAPRHLHGAQEDSFYIPRARPAVPRSDVRPRDYAYAGGQGQGQYAEAPPNVLRVPNSPPRPASRTSTRISDFEIVSAPASRRETPAPRRGSTPGPGIGGERSHTPGTERSRTRSVGRRSESRPRRSSSPQPPREPPRSHTPRAMEEMYQPQTYPEPPLPATTPRPRTPGDSLRSSTKTPVDRTATRTPLDWFFRRRARRRDSTPPNISVEPPSGSVSTHSSGSNTYVQPHLLSPDRVPQPLPMSLDEQMHHVPPPQPIHHIPPTSQSPAIFGHSPDGHLPPLFVPTGPPVPVPPPEETFRIPSPGVSAYYKDVAMKEGRDRAGSDASMESAPLNRPLSIFNE